MQRDPIRKLTSKTLVLAQTDIDTDQIIPARFLTATDKEGFGEKAFYDWRYNEDGSENDSLLNKPESKQCRVLVGGHNFGCGSSREHAPWALLDYGFKAVISTEIADIFRSNALKNGLLPIVVDEDTHQYLIDNPGVEVTIDLETCELTIPQGTIEFNVEAFAKYCLINGIDELGFLLFKEKEISEFEKERQDHAA